MERSSNNQLDPKCFKAVKGLGLSVTNGGYLIPCCRCDHPKTMNDPEFKKLLSVSKISESKSISEILDKKEWQQFYENLSKGIGPHACRNTCSKSKGSEHTQNLKVIDPESEEVVYEVDW